jgi:hypothetical protein
MNLEQFGIQQVRIKHILYKSKVRSALYGGKADDDLILHTSGPVGEWIYQTGLKKYPVNPDMRELEKIHKDLHTHVRNILALYKIGKLQEAREGLTGVEAYSAKFLAALAKLEGSVVREN